MTEPLATLLEVAVYNAVSKKPRPGRPLSRAHCYLGEMLALKLMVEYWKDPTAYAAERAREREFEERLTRLRSEPPPARPRGAYPMSHVLLGNYC